MASLTFCNDISSFNVESLHKIWEMNYDYEAIQVKLLTPTVKTVKHLYKFINGYCSGNVPKDKVYDFINTGGPK